MAAREQAREAAQEAVRGYGVGVEKAADAASAVWEPLLKDLLLAYEHAVEHQGQGHTLYDGTKSVFAWGGYTRAKEALNVDHAS